MFYVICVLMNNADVIFYTYSNFQQTPLKENPPVPLTPPFCGFHVLKNLINLKQLNIVAFNNTGHFILEGLQLQINT